MTAWLPSRALKDRWFGDAVKFAAAYKAKYGYDPDYHAASGAAEVEALVEAIETAGTLDRRRCATPSPQPNFDSLYGTMAFNAERPDRPAADRSSRSKPIRWWPIYGRQGLHREAEVSDAGLERGLIAPASFRGRDDAWICFAQILINGVLLGGLYGVMALGLALVWGVLNIVNLAHGAFIMLGGYLAWYLYTYLGIDPFLRPAGTAMRSCSAFGYALQRGLLNLVVRAAMLNTLLFTFGLDVVLTYLAQLAFSADFRTINPPYAGNSIALGPLVVPLARLMAFGVAVVLTVGCGCCSYAPGSAAPFARPRRIWSRRASTASIRAIFTR